MGTITHKEDRVTLEALLRDGILQSACANPYLIFVFKPSHLWSLPELSRGEVKSRELNDLVAHIRECIRLKREKSIPLRQGCDLLLC